ncbi:MAG TPA: glycosyltransferase family 39 protein [bacterium]|nr:glycosyltransferase family 39 protein [bacterium]
MNFGAKNKEIWLLIAIGTVMFFVYSYLPLSQINWQKQNNVDLSLRFNTPDEVLNYYFSSQYANNGQLYYLEPLNTSLDRVVFPRWALVVQDKITPGSFLGLDLIYGTLGQIFTKNVIPFLTPLFTILGLIFFYLLIKIFFDKKIAFISALLMSVFPGFWYYASRTMFNNVLFLSLFLGGLYFFIRLFYVNQQKSEVTLHFGNQNFKSVPRNSLFIILNSFLAGLFFGLALITRTSEIAWVALMLLVILIFYRKNIKSLWPYLLISLMVAICCLAPVLHQNKILYGGYFSTGYPLTTVSSNLETNSVQTISFLQAILLPFGLNLKNIFFVVYNYIFKLFWPWFILIISGLLMFIKSSKTKEQKLYIYLTLVISYLLLYYGSWVFRDSPISNLISIGSSYVRYFLPLYIFSLPLIAYLLVKVWQWQKLTKILKIFLFIPIIYYLLFIIYYSVFVGPESLPAVKKNLITYNIQAKSILEVVPENAILLLDNSADKIVFPELKHIIVPQGGVEYEPLRKALRLSQKKNIYYFHNKVSDSPKYLNQTKFNPENLEIYEGQNIEGGGVLYKIKLLIFND